jgi:hypothetical protein
MTQHLHRCSSHRTRRLVLQGLPLALALSSQASVAAANLPVRVAGIALPQSALARRAALLSQRVCPDFLFNHGMRTFLFGALFLKKQRLAYDAEAAFVAAALHDVGLLPAYESPRNSFEIDGANQAEKLVRQQSSAKEGDVVWHAVELHDGKWALTQRQGPEAMLVSYGAGADVDGPDKKVIGQAETDAIVAAFPRLQFKRRFTDLLIGHCRRKPTSQRGTWLEGLCREQAPGAWSDTVEKEIAASSFSE